MIKIPEKLAPSHQSGVIFQTAEKSSSFYGDVASSYDQSLFRILVEENVIGGDA